MTPEEYKKLVASKKSVGKPIRQTVNSMDHSRELLRAMGYYFDLDKKKVEYYIKQIELSGKL